MQIIKKSETTAALRRVYWTSVTAADVQSRITGALTAPVTRISVNGAADAAATNSTPTEVDSSMPGIRYTELTEAECATEGTLLIHVSATGMEPRELAVLITENGVFGKPSVSLTHVNAVAIPTPTTGGVLRVDVKAVEANAVTSAAIATDAIGADELAASAVTKIAAGISIPAAATVADAVWDEARAGHVAAGSFGEHVNANVVSMAADTITGSALAESATDEIDDALSLSHGSGWWGSELPPLGPQRVEVLGATERIYFWAVNSTTGVRLLDADVGVSVYVVKDGGAPAAALGTHVAVHDATVPGLRYYEFDADEIPTVGKYAVEFIPFDSSFKRCTISVDVVSPSIESGLTAADVAEAVWDEAVADHTTAGSFGELRALRRLRT